MFTCITVADGTLPRRAEQETVMFTILPEQMSLYINKQWQHNIRFAFPFNPLCYEYIYYHHAFFQLLENKAAASCFNRLPPTNLFLFSMQELGQVKVQK